MRLAVPKWKQRNLVALHAVCHSLVEMGIGFQFMPSGVFRLPALVVMPAVASRLAFKESRCCLCAGAHSPVDRSDQVGGWRMRRRQQPASL